MTKIAVDRDNETIKEMYRWVSEAVTRGCLDGAEGGPLLGFPLRDVEIELLSIVTFPGVTANVVAACASQALEKAVQNANPQLLEPMVRMEIKAPEAYVQNLLNDLGERRAAIESIDRDHELELSVIDCLAPLATLTGFSSTVRHLTSGLGLMHMENAGYRTLSAEESHQVVAEVRGY